MISGDTQDPFPWDVIFTSQQEEHPPTPTEFPGFGRVGGDLRVAENIIIPCIDECTASARAQGPEFV